MPHPNHNQPGNRPARDIDFEPAALPRAAWILFFGTFLNKFGGFVVPFLTLYLTKRATPSARPGSR